VWTLGHTKEEMIALGRKHRVPIGLVLTPAELLGAPSLEDRGFWDEPQTASGPARMPGRPFAGVAWRRPDRLHEPGEDTTAVVADWLGDTVATTGAEAER
jgi:crotonobetainyl-CoA:carnitine CoA-transferase CaiB-like acyl-CoA transferase